MNYYQGCEGHIDPREILGFDFSKSVYIAERKYDGVWAAVTFDSEGDVSLITRNGKVKTNKQLLSLIQYLKETFGLKNAVLAGELAFSTQAGTEYQKKHGHSKVDLFDVLELGGQDLTSKPILERKQILENLFTGRKIPAGEDDLFGEREEEGPFVILAPYFTVISPAEVKREFERIIASGGEGLVIKDTHDLRYRKGAKSPYWLKVKKLVDMDYVIMGYEDSESAKYGKSGWIKNIICGLYENGVLVEKVKVGSMTEEIRQDISENRDKFIGQVIEVHGNEIFKSGSIRHPSFSRFREDKSPEECVWKIPAKEETESEVA